MTAKIDCKIPRYLSAKYESDFAYPTVKDRLPIILTKAIDTVYRLRTDVAVTQHGEKGADALKDIVGKMSKLRNEIQTDKPLLEIEDGRSDQHFWNQCLIQDAEQQKADGDTAGWFHSPWLYVECYMYRRIQEAVALGVGVLKELDPFGEQKRNAFLSSINAVEQLVCHLVQVLSEVEGKDLDQMKIPFIQFMKVALWGNKCDLSISSGSDNSQVTDPVDQLSGLESYILCDQTEQVWKHLISTEPAPRIDIVLDNAGFELLTDICLIEFALQSGLASKVHLHAKAFPWFVSDVTPTDFEWTISQLEQCDKTILADLGKTWRKWIAAGSIVLEYDDFWTTPFDFSSMKSIKPDLYANLSQSSLIIFKGDLNYRKLTGDRKWSCHTSFDTSLRGFHPAPLCALRTLKADIVTGLKEGQAETLNEADPKWMISGNYAVIQFSPLIQ